MYNRVWMVTGSNYGFEVKIFVETTEQGLQDYMESELDWLKDKCYVGATDENVEAAKKIGLKIYCY